jgi:hypothetical protein
MGHSMHLGMVYIGKWDGEKCLHYKSNGFGAVPCYLSLTTLIRVSIF